MKWTILLFVCAVAQAQSTITVSASRPSNIQTDQVSVFMSVAPLDPTATIDDILSVLKGTGATVNNLIPTAGAFDFAAIEWSFQVTVPITGLAPVMAALVADQKWAVATEYNMAFWVSGGSANSGAQACPYTALFGDAQTQARSVAAAAGMNLGAVVSMSDGSDNPTSQSQGASPALSRAAVYDPNPGGVGMNSAILTQPRPACTLVVQFQLLAQ